MIKKFNLVCLTLFLAVGGLPAKTVVLYHTSDTHGFFYPQNGRGGFAALAQVVAKEKNPYLLLDSGDFANGTVETKNSKGANAVTLMNAVGYHAATVGNHEFDFKDVGIDPLLSKAQFAVLAANMREKETKELPAWAQAYAVFERGGIKIGVIGLANRRPTQPSQKYTFTKPLPALEQALNAMQAQHPAVVVVLVHDSLIDYQNNILRYMGDMAKKFGGRIHVVLGGHAHKIFQNEFINGVLYAESGCYLQNVTKVTLDIDDTTGQLKNASSMLIALDTKTVGQDKRIQALAESLKEPGMDEVLGEVGAPLSKRPSQPGHQDSPLDNWIAQQGLAYSGADVFIHNTGGTRINLEPGPFTRRTLFDLFPFDDTVVSFTLTGRELKNFIRKGVLPWNKYVYAGLEIRYQARKGKVKELQVTLNGQPLENKQTYLVATNSYVARHRAFNNVTDKKTVGTQTVRTFIEQALKKGPLFPPATGHLVQE